MGPLQGIKIIEFAGIGPSPFAGMMLADMGAEILRIDRKGASSPLSDLSENEDDPRKNVSARGRKSICLDLKQPEAIKVVLRLIEEADGLIEGFRPGVMERLGLGPEVCHAKNPALVYGRMTGWGQAGELSQSAGHDINYISLSGAVHAMGEADRLPQPPLNIVGDFGAGGMFLAYGMVCALLNAKLNGVGDVVDAAICDGIAALMAPLYGNYARGFWQNERGSNQLDGGAPYYCIYECKDGKMISFGALEDKFFDQFIKVAELDPAPFARRKDRRYWAEIKKILAEVFKQKTRSDWDKLLSGTDVCYAAVLDLDEAPHNSHNKSRNVFVEKDGFFQPAPAPRFQNAPAEMPSTAPIPGEHNAHALLDWGFSAEENEKIVNSTFML